jgi:hypothetical protein
MAHPLNRAIRSSVCAILGMLLTVGAVTACGASKPQPRFRPGCKPTPHRHGCSPSTGFAPHNTVGPYFTASVGTTSSCSSGCSVVGQTLGVSTGTWANSPTRYTYQWDRCRTSSAQPPKTGSCSAISGATSSTYTVQPADVGHALVPIVTAYNGATASSPTGLAGTCDTGEMLGVTAGSSPSVTPSSAPAGCSPISAVAATTQAGETFCTNAVTTCGYADPMNQTAGVPANVIPSTTGACASYANGATISSGAVTINGCKITGQINISGGNVTIENSDLSVADPGGADAPVHITSGAGAVNLDYDTFHGLGTAESESMAWAVWDSNGGAVTIDHSYMYNGDRIAMNDGPSVTITNSWCWSNADVPEHHECVYTLAPNNITEKADVLLNLRDETAANFVDEGNPGGTVDLENNLLGGGDYCLYGGRSSDPAEEYLDNRFTRALYSTCGLYGLSTYDSDGTFTSSGNIWDDTGSPAPP